MKIYQLDEETIERTRLSYVRMYGKDLGERYLKETVDRVNKEMAEWSLRSR